MIGFHFLVKTPGLKEFWTKLYNTPIVPYTKYNNTIVLGSFVIGVLLLIPIYFLAKAFVRKYRTTWMERMMKFKVVQIIKASAFYRYYLTYKGLQGD